MSRWGNCYDNAHAESFWSRFKAELLDGSSFPGLAEAKLEISHHIAYYNAERRPYDANGNLRTMNRKGLISAAGQPAQYGDMDELQYHYDTDADKTNDGESNRLLAVDDKKVTSAKHDFEDASGLYTPGTSTAEYTYDAMGNLTSDRNKGITNITYTYQNLPRKIDMPMRGDIRHISYIYTAKGTKLAKTAFTKTLRGVITSATTYYAGAFVYEEKQGINNSYQPVTLQFAHMPEGRLLYTVTPPNNGHHWKYEYHLKDHLGNLRFAFRDEGDDELQRMLSMEPVNATQEEQQFERVAETRMQDGAHARTGNYVARLNAKEGRRMGPNITWPVAPGDSIYAEVYGRYDHPALVGKVLQKGAIVTGAAAAGSPASIATDQVKATPAKRRAIPFFGASLAIVPQLFKRQKEELPQAFLRYELYNQDSQLVATRIQPLVRTATDEWQRLTTGVKADSAGYVRVAVINESGTPAYFDDLALRSVDPAKVQENHYDPWGMNLVGIEDAGEPDFKFQFSGKEKQEDFNLNWQDFKWRYYDVTTARFFSVDRLAEKFVYMTPYQFASNEPVGKIELDGLEGINANSVRMALLKDNVTSPLISAPYEKILTVVATVKIGTVSTSINAGSLYNVSAGFDATTISSTINTGNQKELTLQFGSSAYEQSLLGNSLGSGSFTGGKYQAKFNSKNNLIKEEIELFKGSYEAGSLNIFKSLESTKSVVDEISGKKETKFFEFNAAPTSVEAILKPDKEAFGSTLASYVDAFGAFMTNIVNSAMNPQEQESSYQDKVQNNK